LSSLAPDIKTPYFEAALKVLVIMLPSIVELTELLALMPIDELLIVMLFERTLLNWPEPITMPVIPRNAGLRTPFMELNATRVRSTDESKKMPELPELPLTRITFPVMLLLSEVEVSIKIARVVVPFPEPRVLFSTRFL
jgi:hypothetical protein